MTFMRYVAFSILALISVASSADLELNLPIAKLGSGYGFDWQSSAQYSFGVEGGKWSDPVYYLGPTLDYGVGPFSFDLAAVGVFDHATKAGLVPEAQYQWKRWTLDANYLVSAGNKGLSFSIGFHL